MNEYRAGFSGLKFMLTLKGHHWQEDPWAYYRSSLPQLALAREAVQHILEGDHRHPRLLEFQADPLRSQAQRFVDGQDVFDFEHDTVTIGMEELACTLGAGCFSWTLEWLG